MNARLKLLLTILVCASTMLSSALGQASKLKGLISYSESNLKSQQFGSMVVPEIKALPRPAVSEDILRDLDFFLSPRSASVVSFSNESYEKSRFGYSLKESSMAEFAVSGAADLKRFKSGFTMKNPFGGPDINAYIKSGVAWHPEPNVTFTFNPRKTTWIYRFKNGHDFKYQVWDRPIMGLISILEWPFQKVSAKVIDK